jgi:hypothetical protein
MSLSLTTRVSIAIAGAGLAVGGLVLVLRASWLALDDALGPIWAHSLIGVGLIAVAIIVIAATRQRPPPEPAPLAAIFTAFTQGLAAGRQTGRRSR